jgi:hypothetical protein
MAPRRKKQKCGTTTIVVAPVELPVSVQQQILEIDGILQNILSYVGSHQYLFIASINHTFRNVYTKLYPSKVTYYNGSTMKHLKLCYQTTLSYNATHSLFQSTARHGNMKGLRYLQTKNGYTIRFNQKTIEIVVMNKHLNILKWAHNSHAIGMSNVVPKASYHGKKMRIDWLYINHETGCNLFLYSSIGGTIKRCVYKDI